MTESGILKIKFQYKEDLNLNFRNTNNFYLKYRFIVWEIKNTQTPRLDITSIQKWKVVEFLNSTKSHLVNLNDRPFNINNIFTVIDLH